ncbi:hypothetical protein MJG53_014115 [Ovis ammon polii x Ovis aries]|uniref:Uncharacterized protein n=1 Tax=Ovis ammon polii x Ovis aries TaxID=2918886 RepID=A0ACB9UKV2_9CETA|nr:hypothetical protein MJG53_014115 [Ovis ammon polii x Ovis aries]
MAKEGVEKAEETEQMIEKEAGKEPAEGGGGGGSHRLGDAQEMRAVVLAGFGGLNKLRVTRKAMPEPQDGELKIRVKAWSRKELGRKRFRYPAFKPGESGLNFIDLMVRQGNIDNPPKTPLVPGFECSGIVEALGDSVKGFEIGDRVMAFVNYNAWAEVVCTPVEFVYKIPEDMSFSEAAAFPMNFVTAYMMLFEVANLREGMSVLIHSAGGGVVSGLLCVLLPEGQAVAQLCSTVPNVTVFGTASTFKHEAIKDSVTHLFDRNADYVQEVKRISAEGVDIVLDCLCGDNTGKGLSLLKPLGTYILYGSSNMVTGETKSFFSFAKSWWQVEKVNPIKLYEENKVIAGFSLLNLLFKQGRAGLIRGVVDKLTALYNQKKIKPVVDSLWALEEVNVVHSSLQERAPTYQVSEMLEGPEISRSCSQQRPDLVSQLERGEAPGDPNPWEAEVLRGICPGGKSSIKTEELAVGPYECKEPGEGLRSTTLTQHQRIGTGRSPGRVKEAMQRIHDRGNIGKLILDVEKTPTPLMANDSTETSEAGEEEEDHEGDGENKERMPFIQ